jgi:hypothetical protein
VATTAIEARPSSIWTRAAERLNNWGSKIVGFAKRVGNWFASKTKWLWNSKPVQWVATKASFVAGKAWSGVTWAWAYAKGPILWVATPILAFWAMPTTATILLGVGVLALGIVAFFTWRGWMHLRNITTPEELHQVIDRLERLSEPQVADKDVPMAFDDDPVPGETVQERLDYLDEMQKQSKDGSLPGGIDKHRFSESQARMNLLMVKRGDEPGCKPNNGWSNIHRYGKKMALLVDPDPKHWNFDLMARATEHEFNRLKALEESMGQQKASA